MNITYVKPETLKPALIELVSARPNWFSDFEGRFPAFCPKVLSQRNGTCIRVKH